MSWFIYFALIGILLPTCLAGCRNMPAGTPVSSQPEEERYAAICPIDGEPASESSINRRPLAVMIENSPAARPQSGLDQACVVYEAVTEGGITRFMAVYLHQEPAVIEPVRSLRPHFIDLAREFDAALTHCGQSYEALQILARDPSIRNLDQMKNDRPFKRDKTRRAPHNLVASGEKLRALMNEKGWGDRPAELPCFVSNRKISDSCTPATHIVISFGGAVKYRLEYEYDPAKDAYRRIMDGKLHIDRQTGQPLLAKNIVIQYVASAPFAKSTKETQDVRVVGDGTGIFIGHGKSMPLGWSKYDEGSITRYSDGNGKPLPFQPGQTWVELVPTGGKVKIVK